MKKNNAVKFSFSGAMKTKLTHPSHTPPQAIGTLSPLPSRPCKDIIPHPQRCPLLTVTEGPLAKVWDNPPSPSNKIK